MAISVFPPPCKRAARLTQRPARSVWRWLSSKFGDRRISRQAFESLKADALYVTTDALFNANRIRINTFALSARLPTIYPFREHVEAGGLMSYGANIPDLFRRAAGYVDRILRGAKPADLPVEQPIKFDLIVNLSTAKALGLTVPESFLVRADGVIE
jgi:putative ABC transport system substrate-binding protein